MKPIFGNFCSRLLFVWMLGEKMFDRISEEEPELGVLPIHPKQVVEVGEYNSIDAETNVLFVSEEGLLNFATRVLAQGVRQIALRQIVKVALVQKLQ